MVSPIDLRIAGHDQRIEDVDQRCGIAPDRALRRLLHGGRQHLPQPRIARGLGDRGRQDAVRSRPPSRSGSSTMLAEPRQHLDLAPDQQGPQLLEPQDRPGARRFAARAAPASRLCAISTSRPASAFRSMPRHRPRAGEAAAQAISAERAHLTARISWPASRAMVRSPPLPAPFGPRPGSGTWRPRRTARRADCDRS